jgi:16S rRNA processing protein RimM
MSPSGKAPQRRLLLGEIVGAHGIRGAVLIKTYTATPDGIAVYGPLEDETGHRELAIRIERVTPKGVIARIAGVGDRTAAEQLKGTRLYVRRERLPETPTGEFYIDDLIGLAAVDAEGASLGEVVAVANYGACDVLEIRLKDSKATELIPFTEHYVLEVDLSGGRIRVAMPLGSSDDDEGKEG